MSCHTNSTRNGLGTFDWHGLLPTHASGPPSVTHVHPDRLAICSLNESFGQDPSMTTKRCTHNGFNASAPASYEATKRYACTCFESFDLAWSSWLDFFGNQTLPTARFRRWNLFQTWTSVDQTLHMHAFHGQLASKRCTHIVFITNCNPKHASMHLPVTKRYAHKGWGTFG